MFLVANPQQQKMQVVGAHRVHPAEQRDVGSTRKDCTPCKLTSVILLPPLGGGRAVAPVTEARRGLTGIRPVRPVGVLRRGQRDAADHVGRRGRHHGHWYECRRRHGIYWHHYDGWGFLSLSGRVDLARGVCRHDPLLVVGWTGPGCVVLAFGLVCPRHFV